MVLGALRFFEVIGFFAVAVELGEELGDGCKPETAEDFIIFFGADATINNICGGGLGGNAVTHQWLRNKSKGAFFSA